MSPLHSNKVHLKFDQSILARLPLDGHSLAIGQMHTATGWVLAATRQMHTATGWVLPATGWIHTATRQEVY